MYTDKYIYTDMYTYDFRGQREAIKASGDSVKATKVSGDSGKEVEASEDSDQEVATKVTDSKTKARAEF